MKTLIINGFPKESRGNTKMFIRQFLLGAGQNYPVHYAVKESAHELAQTADPITYYGINFGVITVFLKRDWIVRLYRIGNCEYMPWNELNHK